MVTLSKQQKFSCRIVIVFCILLIANAQSISQSAPDDQIEALYKEVWASSWDDVNVSKDFVRRSLEILDTNGKHRRMSRFAIYVARESTIVFGDIIPLDSLRKILNLCEKVVSERDSSFRFLPMILNAKGVAVSHQGLYDSAYRLNSEAIEYGKAAFERSLNNRDRANILGTLVISYTNMGHALFSTTDFEDPLERRNEIGPKLVRIFLSADSLSVLVAKYSRNSCYSPMMQKVNLANIYGHYYRNAALSQKYFAESLKVFSECGDTEKLCQVYNSMAYTMLMAKDTAASIRAARQAIAHVGVKRLEFYNRWSKHESHFILSTIFFAKKKYDSAVYHGNVMLGDSSVIKKPGDIAKIASLMADYYLRKGDLSKSVKYLEVARDYLQNFNLANQQRSIITQDKSRMVLDIVKRIETVEEGISYMVKFQWIIWSITVLAGSGIIISAYILLKRRRVKDVSGVNELAIRSTTEKRQIKIRSGGWNRILIVAIVLFPVMHSSAQKHIRLASNVDSVYNKLFQEDWNDKKAILPYFAWGLEVARSLPEHQKGPRVANFLSRSAVVLYSELGQDSVFKILDLCFKIVKLHDSVEYHMPDVIRNKGIYFQQHGNYDSAFIYHQKTLSYYFKAHKNSVQENDWILNCIGSAYNNMGHALFCTTDPSDSPEKKLKLGSRILKYFMTADSLNQRVIKISGDSCYYGTTSAIVNIANIYGHYYVNRALSELYYRKALDRILYCKDSVRLTGLYNSIAWTKRFLKDTVGAVQAAEKCIYYSKLIQTTGNAVTRVEANHLLSNIYFHQKNYEKLIIHANQIFDDTVYVKKPFAISLVSAMLAESYLKGNDVKKSLTFLLMSKRYLARYTSSESQQASILSSEESRKVKSVVDIIERVQKDVHRREAIRDLWLIIAFLFVLVMNGVIVYLLIKRKRAMPKSASSDDNNQSPVAA